MRKDTSVNVRMSGALRRKLEFLAATEGRGLSDFARQALEKKAAEALIEIAAKTDGEAPSHA